MPIQVRDFQAVMQNTKSGDVVLRTVTSDAEVEVARIEFAELKRGETVELKGEFLLYNEVPHPFELETRIYRTSRTSQVNKELYRLRETLGCGSIASTSSAFLYFIDQISENHAQVTYTVTATIHSDAIEQVDLKLPLSFAGTVYSPHVPKAATSPNPHKYRTRTRMPRHRR
ncbi:hypothetical protein [Laceyella putida]|uniref:Uncharacterized protein n=1 Tax=Laceyella putida TaxID=110101 RepID=A0ABW2RNC3_9BACL